MKIINIIQEIQSKKKAIGTPGLSDTQLLIAHILNTSRPWVITHVEDNITKEQSRSIFECAELLISGVPLPYIIGKWEFYNLEFNLDQSVLIPRPETEILVEKAIAKLMNTPGSAIGADIGTGSGCIAISLAVNLPKLTIFASDISFNALHIAQINASKHEVEKRVHLIQTNLFPPLNISYDFICANLPYIPTLTLQELPVYTKEPTHALDGGADGLEIIRPFLEQASRYLKPHGSLFCEIEASNSEQVLNLARATFPTSTIYMQKDLAGYNRCIIIENLR